MAANIKRLRLERGLTQEGLADAAGLHRNYVGGVERAERNVSIDNIDKIARTLGVSMAVLVASG